MISPLQGSASAIFAGSTARGSSSAPRASTPKARDIFGRLLTSLRLSVTDRCNLRCAYCMPGENYTWLPRRDLLSFEEIERLVDLFCGLGTRRIRLTGGEPLLRPGLPQLISRLIARPLVQDLGLTTNGVLLSDQAEALLAGGLPRLTVSLDTLDRQRYHSLTGRDEHARVLAGIDAALGVGFKNTKLNVVVMRGFNDDEIEDFVRFGREKKIEVRFIEYMDVGGATNWNPQTVVDRAEVLARLDAAFGGATALKRPANATAPAEQFVLGDGTLVGVIASTSAPFCGTCDRSRLTADGTWFQCLYARDGSDLRSPLRAGASDSELTDRIRCSWGKREDRGAESRQQARERRPLANGTELRENPHLEMHTRGG